MGDFDGQVAFVTGGARGQGRNHAIALAQRGADIVVCDRCADFATLTYPMATPDDLAETVKLVEETGRGCLAVQGDVRDAGAVDQVVAGAMERFGRVDILLANAGVAAGLPVQDTTPQVWEDVVGTNLTGVFNAIHAVAPVMIAQRSGRIVATSSMMGRSTTTNVVAYSTSKWGVIGMVKASAHDLAPYGVTVNAVAPGNVATDMILNESMYRIVRPDLEHPTAEDAAAAMQLLHVQPIPWMDVQEVTDVILFLLGPAARHITGAVIDISAGASARFTA